jgi:hypothetical protein
MDKIPEPLSGYNRQWVKCKACGQVAYYDYIPYSLANPAMILPCGHGAAQKFYDAVDNITPEQAMRELRIKCFAAPGPDDNPNGPGWYFTNEIETKNIKITRHIGPYPDWGTARMALFRFDDAVETLRQVIPGERGLYIHLTEREDDQ